METSRARSRRRTVRPLGTSKETWSAVRPASGSFMEMAATTPSFLKRRTLGVGGQVRWTMTPPDACGCSNVVRIGAQPVAAPLSVRPQSTTPARMIFRCAFTRLSHPDDSHLCACARERLGPATPATYPRAMIVHLLDGTYELFRHFYGQRRFNEGKDKPFGAVVGLLHSVLEMIETGATHLGVATDHVIESFRNELWPDYKTGEGIDPALWLQFHPLEDALTAMGVTTWAQVETEADDALASAARLASEDARVQKVCIWTPDKDLAQCVRDDRVVQIDRKSKAIRNATAVREKFGVDPPRIADFLALVGDTADGYPGIDGIGKMGAARLVNKYGPLESFPENALGAERRALALRFKELATLRADLPLFSDIDALRWRGPT